MTGQEKLTHYEFLRDSTKEEFIAAVKEWMANFVPPVSQAELAREMAQQPQHVSKWMQCKVDPSLANRRRMVAALDALDWTPWTMEEGV